MADEWRKCWTRGTNTASRIDENVEEPTWQDSSAIWIVGLQLRIAYCVLDADSRLQLLAYSDHEAERKGALHLLPGTDSS